MTPEEIKMAIADAIAPLAAKLAAIESAAVAPAAPAVEDDEEMKAKMQSVAKDAALSVLREFSASLPTPVAVSAPAPEPTVETFETIVRGLKAGGTKHNDAIRKAMSEKPALYTDYLSRAQKGEVILF